MERAESPTAGKGGHGAPSESPARLVTTLASRACSLAGRKSSLQNAAECADEEKLDENEQKELGDFLRQAGQAEAGQKASDQRERKECQCPGKQENLSIISNT